MGAYLSAPVTTKSSDFGGDSQTCTVYGLSSMQGWRHSMEDAHIALPTIKDNNISIYGVFDGHGGGSVAKWVSQNFKDEFLRLYELHKANPMPHPKLLPTDYDGIPIDINLYVYASALQATFFRMDEMMITPASTKEIRAIYNIENNKDSTKKTEMDIYENNYYTNLRNAQYNLRDYVADKWHISDANGEVRNDVTREQLEQFREAYINGDVYTDSNFAFANKNASGDTNTSNSSAHEPENKDSHTQNFFTQENEKDDTKNSFAHEPENRDTHAKNSPAKENKKEDTHANNSSTHDSERENAHGDSSNNVNEGSNENMHTHTEQKPDKSMPDESEPVIPQFDDFSDLDQNQAMNMLILDYLESLNVKPHKDQSIEEVEEDQSIEEDEEDQFMEEDEEDQSMEDDDEFQPNEVDYEQFSTNPILAYSWLASLRKEEIQDMCGTTAIVAVFVTGSTPAYIIANAGDSRAVLSRWKKAITLSVDHKPSIRDEYERITKAGGSVISGRVDGNLNLSRSLGDLNYKRDEKLKPQEQKISCLPDISICWHHKLDDFMVIACDGIWDCKTEQEVVDFVNERLTENSTPEDLSKISEELCDSCLSVSPDTNEGVGCDNMTCIIIKPSPSLLDTASYNPPIIFYNF